MLNETHKVLFLFQQRVDLRACGSDGSYYKLSALLNMTSDRTKVSCWSVRLRFASNYAILKSPSCFLFLNLIILSFRQRDN